MLYRYIRVSSTQLIRIFYIICKSRSSNPEHHNSSHLKCVTLTTGLLDKKKNQKQLFAESLVIKDAQAIPKHP